MRARELRFVFAFEEFDAAVRLFRDVLGLEVIEDFGDQAGRGILLALPSATLEVIDREHEAYVDRIEAEGPQRAGPRIAVRVDDLVSAEDPAQAAGLTAVADLVSTPWGDRNRRYLATDGFQITLFQGPEPPPPTGC
jgi:lactoylglutathione lyase